jgi:hypothetical protein
VTRWSVPAPMAGPDADDPAPMADQSLLAQTQIQRFLPGNEAADGRDPLSAVKSDRIADIGQPARSAVIIGTLPAKINNPGRTDPETRACYSPMQCVTPTRPVRLPSTSPTSADYELQLLPAA